MSKNFNWGECFGMLRHASACLGSSPKTVGFHPREFCKITADAAECFHIASVFHRVLEPTSHHFTFLFCPTVILLDPWNRFSRRPSVGPWDSPGWWPRNGMRGASWHPEKLGHFNRETHGIYGETIWNYDRLQGFRWPWVAYFQTNPSGPSVFRPSIQIVRANFREGLVRHIGAAYWDHGGFCGVFISAIIIKVAELDPICPCHRAESILAKLVLNVPLFFFALNGI